MTGDYYFLGAIAMNVAGLCEFILGNTYTFAVFVIFGSHWGALAYAQDPIYKISSAFAAVGGAEGAAQARS